MDWSWLDRVDDVEFHGPVDDVMVARAEERIGRFPPEYRDVVLAWWHDDDSLPEHMAASFAGWLRSLANDEGNCGARSA